jgi:hypothetical protein
VKTHFRNFQYFLYKKERSKHVRYSKYEIDIFHYKISQFYRRKNSVGVWLEVRRWFFLRPSALPSSVIPHYVGISVGKTKKSFTDGFIDGTCAPKKKDSRLKYTDGFSFHRWNLNYRRKISVVTSVGECMKYRRINSVCTFVGTGGSYC